MLRVSDGPTLDNADGGESRRWTRSEAGWLDHRHGREIDGHHRRTGLMMIGCSGSHHEIRVQSNSPGQRKTPAAHPVAEPEGATEGRRIGFENACGSGTGVPPTSREHESPDPDGAVQEVTEKGCRRL